MGKTTLEDIWDEYLELEPDERPQFLYDASITLKDQGNETAQRAVLYQAIEDSFEVGNFQTGANASVELSKWLSAADEHQEAVAILSASIERLPPWQGFELGLTFRALAWACKASGDPLGHETNLKISMAHFDSSAFTEWSFPLRNELGEILLEREDWSSLADLLSPEQCENEECVTPIAQRIRGYLLGRLALTQLNWELAIRNLLVSVLAFERDNHRLLGEALDSLSWAIQRSGGDVSEVLESYESELGIEPHVRHRLASELYGNTWLFL